jgi:hypothetical protein
LLKASIALVGVAFVALAIGWVTGQDPLLYASIVCSALGGIALVKTTLSDRKRGPASGEEQEPRRAGGKKKVSRREAKKQETLGRPVAAAELLEEDSSVRTLQGVPARNDSGIGEHIDASQAQAPLDEEAIAGYTDAPEPPEIDFRSRLAAALDTSSLEEQLEEEGDQEEDDGLLVSRLRAKEGMAHTASEGGIEDDDVIEVDWREEEAGRAVVGAVAQETPARMAEEDITPDWIRIDDLPQIMESFGLTRGPRKKPVTRTSSVPAAARKGPAARPTTSRAKEKTKPSAAPKSSPKKPPSRARDTGSSQARTSSAPKQPTGGGASGRPAPPKAGSTARPKPAAKPAQPRATAAKRGPGRPPKTKA